MSDTGKPHANSEVYNEWDEIIKRSLDASVRLSTAVSELHRVIGRLEGVEERSHGSA